MSGAAFVLAWQLARLQGPAVEAVQWVAPPGCPDRADLLAGVVLRRGRALAPGEARIAGRTSAVGPRRFRLELELEAGDRRETRVLMAHRCSALVDAAALLVVVAVEAARPLSRATPIGAPPVRQPLPRSATTRRGRAASSAAPAGAVAQANTRSGAAAGEGARTEAPVVPAIGTAVEAAPVDRAPVVPPPLAAVDVGPFGPSRASVEVAALELPELEGASSPAPTPRRRPGGFVRVHGIGEVGALPGPTGGVGLAGGLLWRHVRVELQGTFLAPRASAHPLAEVRAFLLAGAALGCARLGRGGLELPLCAGLELGAQRGSAAGPEVRAAAFGRWLAVALAAGVAWRAHRRVALWGAVQGLAAIERPTFLLREPGPEVVLFDPGVLSVRVAVGIELRFGDPR